MLVHAILPGVTLVVVTAGLWIYSMRNNMITTLAEDYVKMGRAKGLKSWRIMIDYAARNAILPNLTGFAMQLGYVLGRIHSRRIHVLVSRARLSLLHEHDRSRPAT